MQLCNTCTRPLPPVPLFCPACPLATFCSTECRAASAHQPGGCECGVPWTLLLPQDAVLASRAVRRAQSGVRFQLPRDTGAVRRWPSIEHERFLHGVAALGSSAQSSSSCVQGGPTAGEL